MSHGTFHEQGRNDRGVMAPPVSGQLQDPGTNTPGPSDKLALLLSQVGSYFILVTALFLNRTNLIQKARSLPLGNVEP